MLITANLSDALCRFRHRDIPRYLWADAVCINQADNVEKSSHITLMTDIYRAATTVLVWLGQGKAGEEAIIQFQKIRRLLQFTSHPLLGKYFQGLENSICTLLAMPWFSRRWIIQEVVLNPSVYLHCGSQHLSFPWFCVASQMLRAYK